MKVGDLIYDDERGQYAVIAKVINGHGPVPLYEVLLDDGDWGYAYHSDVVAVERVIDENR